VGEIFERALPAEPLEWTGERLTTATAGQVEIEHLHRYCLARALCRGLDVLDVASGEGYGAALLAQTARTVVGVELAAAAVAHARRSYTAPNLRYLAGDARQLPLPDAAVDMVVSFETIEHFYEHDAFLAEVRRVLRPGGRLVISSPERDIYSPPGGPVNSFHVRELTRDEFVHLLQRYFAHVAVQGQRPLLGSALIAEEAARAGRTTLTFERRGPTRFEACEGLPRPIYLVAVAADAAVAELPDSLFVQTSEIGALLSELDALRARAAAPAATAGRDQGRAAAEATARAAAAEAALADVSAQREALRTALQRRLVPLQAEIEVWRGRHDALHEKLQAVYAQAVALTEHQAELQAVLQAEQARVVEEQGRTRAALAAAEAARGAAAAAHAAAAEAEARAAELAEALAAAQAAAAAWQEQYQALQAHVDRVLDRLRLRRLARLLPASGRRFIQQRLFRSGSGS
jgi:SAM-dependent methyltransferase